MGVGGSLIVVRRALMGLISLPMVLRTLRIVVGIAPRDGV
jgi:hypothetical protein